ncbi:DNA-binding transcriptional regulator, MerR family [Paenibacillus catalpae]|uniref:DNA-binding transcriptional regulator, MerR family n=1 Tax=Paenibacillus catalpae TaxID=1045775 RepID=A0A1I1XFE1_9BACL|nr:MerR family transcriptional regulator [Paenibacillus catalpae]SFE06077.1 DNA-binding transcriptional regulator, MerR family [Paenibacillus catalpae]
MEKYYSSRQVSERTGLSIHTLRYYEQIGLIDGIARDDNGYRQYSESDIVWFQVLNYFRTIGMSIREMQEYASFNNSEEVPTLTARREFIESYRRKVVEQMAELERSLDRIDEKIGFFKNLENSNKRQPDN